MGHKRSTTQQGDAFEACIHDYFSALIASDRFWAKKDNCRIFRKRGYHSRDRNSSIVFDIAIEVYLPGSEEYSTVVLIECKDYSEPVPVSDLEEFFAKVQQVSAARAKAVFASTAAFQSGAREFARSKGIGLIRYFSPENFKWELKRSPSASARSSWGESSALANTALSEPKFTSTLFDFYLQSPIRETNSVSDFFEDLVLDSGLSPTLIRSIANSKRKIAGRVPFVEKEDLEGRSSEILAEIGYSGAEVDLDSICDREKTAAGLVVRTNVSPVPPSRTTLPLGQITFSPLVIEIFATQECHRARERFTLAHELAHHLLDHGTYMAREYCEEEDFALYKRSVAGSSDIARLEFQANYFAASLLMPRAYFLRDFQQLAIELELHDHGFGALYLDEQPCNVQTFFRVTNHYMQQYGVSRAAAKIRLQSLGLLRDAGDFVETRQVLRFFESETDARSAGKL